MTWTCGECHREQEMLPETSECEECEALLTEEDREIMRDYCADAMFELRGD